VTSERGEAPMPARVLLVDEEITGGHGVVGLLHGVWPDGLLVIHAREPADAIHELGVGEVTCVVFHAGSDPDEATLEQLAMLSAAAPEAPIIVLSDNGDDAFGIAAVKTGAQDHLFSRDLSAGTLSRSVHFAIERKRAEVRLSNQALQDPLTELPNRALFLDRLSVAMDRSRRTGLAPAIMFLDLDSFKQINDTLGHAAGDRLLSVLAERFHELLRPMDTVARMGGDEFTFLFERRPAGRSRSAAAAARPPSRPRSGSR
jgi:two-component system cell cycle response regulator